MPKIWYIYENGFNIRQAKDLKKAINHIQKLIGHDTKNLMHSSDYKTYFKIKNYEAKLEEIKK